MTDNVIGPDENWQQNRREDGEYRHPVLFSEENNYQGGAGEWEALLAKYNLDEHYWFLGDGYPRSEEVKLREIYDSAPADGWEESIRKWVPREESTPVAGNWFLLAIYDTEDGPACVWGCVKS